MSDCWHFVLLVFATSRLQSDIRKPVRPTGNSHRMEQRSHSWILLSFVPDYFATFRRVDHDEVKLSGLALGDGWQKDSTNSRVVATWYP
jgi:hypothetical protein